MIINVLSYCTKLSDCCGTFSNVSIDNHSPEFLIPEAQTNNSIKNKNSKYDFEGFKYSFKTKKRELNTKITEAFRPFIKKLRSFFKEWSFC